MLGLAFNTLNAQITLDLSDFGVINDSVKIAQDTMPGSLIAPGAAGTAQTWDFSSLNLHYNNINIFKDPNALPNGNLFPGANIVYTSLNYNAFIQANSSIVELKGADGDLVGAGVNLPLPFTDGQTILNLPTAFGDMFLDTTTFRGTFKATDIDPAFSLFDSIRIAHYGYAENNIDAWGDMILPGETKSVLRKKRVERTVDSVWVKFPGSPVWQMAPAVPPFLTANPRIDTLRSYEWYAKGEKYTYVTMNVDANDQAQDVSYVYKGSLAITLIPSHVSCFGGNDGSLSVNFSVVAPGTPPYTYLWSDGSTASSLSNLVAGNYSITVTDADGYIASYSTSINQPADITATSTVTDAHCSTCNNGDAIITVNGGTPGYVYSWSNGGTTSAQANLLPGTYTVSITDILGCSEVHSLTVGFWPVSVEEIDKEKNTFVAYPNPSKTQVFIPQAENVALYDLLGNQIPVNYTNNYINVSNIPAGIYLISAYIDGKSLFKQLIVE